MSKYKLSFFDKHHRQPRSYKEYFEVHDTTTTRQVRQDAEEYMKGYKDVPRFDNPETVELLKRNGRRYWCQKSRDERIRKWIAHHCVRRKYVTAIAHVVQLSEAKCLEIYRARHYDDDVRRAEWPRRHAAALRRINKQG